MGAGIMSYRIPFHGQFRLIMIVILSIGVCLMIGCPPFPAQTAYCPDANKSLSYSGRIPIGNNLALFDGAEWRTLPENLWLSTEDGRYAVDSNNEIIYSYFGAEWRDANVKPQLWAFSLKTLQQKLLISDILPKDSVLFPGYKNIHGSMHNIIWHNNELYFCSNDTLITLNGAIDCRGIMKYDGNTFSLVDTMLRGEVNNIFFLDDYLYLSDFKRERGDTVILSRYSLVSKQYEILSPGDIFPLASKSSYFSVGYSNSGKRFIYINGYDYKDSFNTIYQYDVASKSVIIILSGDLGYDEWYATDNYLFFLDAKITYQGNSYYGDFIYNVVNDNFFRLDTMKISPVLTCAVWNNTSLLYGGRFRKTNGVDVGNIARYDVSERKTYALDGGVYAVATDNSCNTGDVEGIIRVKNKLLVRGYFESAGLRF